MSLNPRNVPHVVLVAVLSACTAQATVESVTVSPDSVIGTDSSTGTVTLTAVSPFLRTVVLQSGNVNAATVPSSVLVPPGRRTATFNITTYPVVQNTNVTIAATEGGVTDQDTLTVRPPSLVSVSVNPATVVGGANSTATITINRPAHANWLCNISGTSPPVYFISGSLVGFQTGATTATKTINTQAVAMPIAATIRVNPPTGQSPFVTTLLTVEPLYVSSVVLTPPSVAGGRTASARVTLNGAAPPSGATVGLTSGDPSVVSVPGSAMVAADASFVDVPVSAGAPAACVDVEITATLNGSSAGATLAVGRAAQLTLNTENDRWSPRHPTTARGGVLWTNGPDVYFHDGNATTLVQPLGALEMVEDTVLGLGTGATPNQVVGAWRRGSDFAWVWVSDDPASPRLVHAINPFNADNPMNPEAVAIADGAVFLALQAVVGGVNVRNVFRVDPATGDAVNLTGAAVVPGAARITTSNGRAAWTFDNGGGEDNVELHLYEAGSVRIVDSGPIRATAVRLHGRWLVYQKQIGGVQHIVSLDVATPGATPQVVSPTTDASHGHFRPTTDGRHIAWLFGDADETDLQVLLLGGVTANDPANAPVSGVNVEFPVQLHRGQLLWRGAGGVQYFYADGAASQMCTTPSGAPGNPWLADGVVAWHALDAEPGATDNEIFRGAFAAPDDEDQPPPPLRLLAAPRNGAVDLSWDRVLGAELYSVYYARIAGVTKENYALLPGGARRIVLTNSTTIAGLANNQPHYFVVTAIEAGDEGGESHEASATPSSTWIQTAAGTYFALSAYDRFVYAAGATTTYKSTNHGATWSPLSGAISNRPVRGVAADAARVLAATRDGDVLRSMNAGGDWTIVADGSGVGESTAAVAMDPADADLAYAGNMQLAPNALSFMIRSTDGGATWEQLPPDPSGEIRAYSIAIDAAGAVYVAGSGVPLARSVNHGATWTDLQPGVFLTRGLALDPFDAQTIWVGAQNGRVRKTVNAGALWADSYAGLPAGESVNALLADAGRTGRLYAGTAAGVFASYNAGASWQSLAPGVEGQYVYALAMTANRTLVAATFDGLFTLPLGCEGDVTGDGSVDLTDLATLLVHFGQPANARFVDGDLDGDGAVTLTDLATLLSRFGTPCP